MLARVIGMVILRTAVAEVTRGIVRDVYIGSKSKFVKVIRHKDVDQMIEQIEFAFEEGE